MEIIVPKIKPLLVKKKIPLGVPLEDIRNGLVLDFDFMELSGSKTIDQSEQENHGTINGASRVNGLGSGRALSFDGVDDYVRVADDASLSVRTLAIWFKSDKWVSSGGYSPTILNKYTDDDNMFRIAFNETAGGRIAVSVMVEGTEVGRHGTGGVSLNVWHHLVVVFTSPVKIYLDGIDITSTDSCTWSRYAVTNNLYIGQRGGGGGLFDGLIGEVRLYNRVLSAAEIRQMYYYSLYKCDMIC